MRVLLVLLLAFALAAPRVHSNMLATYLSIGLVALLAVIASLVAIVAYATHRPKSILIVSGLHRLGAVGREFTVGNIGVDVRSDASHTFDQRADRGSHYRRHQSDHGLSTGQQESPRCGKRTW